MALTDFQKQLCRLIAQQRVASGESYIAGAAALNEAIGAPRLSRDVDLFHDTETAVDASFEADQACLERSGFTVTLLRRRSGFVEALVRLNGQQTLMQWVRDSAFRFFPLVEHDDFGLVLHPLDLATNKVLALIGRVEVRDWVDVIETSERLQPLGYVAWAAVGKDPGFSPSAVIEHAARSARYSGSEVATLAFDGAAPDAADLSRRWHAHVDRARELVSVLPPGETGKCVLDDAGVLFRGTPEQARDALGAGRLRFHPGSIRGALPQFAD